MEKKSRLVKNARLIRCLAFLSSYLFAIAIQAQDTIYVYKTDTVYVKPFSQTIHLGATPSETILLKTNNAFSVGIGSADMYDTYLSPLKYKGTSLQINYEQMLRTRWFNHNFYKQQVFDINLAKGANPSGNASDYWGMFNYRLGGHYAVLRDKNLRAGVGGLWDTSLGVLYSERNGNNPASARAFSNLSLSAIASYKISKLAFRWQIDAPMAGVLFSPEYGQSYYEMSLGNSVGLINFASFHNQRALRNYFTVDFALGTYIIRGGFQSSYYQTKIKNLQTHHYTHNFILGFPIESVKMKCSKAKNAYWD